MAAGRKTGGRRKGSRNMKTLEILDGAAKGGEMPLNYMLRVMRNEKASDERRDHMAVMAAPYVHSRLSAIEHGGNADKPIRVVVRVMTTEADA